MSTYPRITARDQRGENFRLSSSRVLLLKTERVEEFRAGKAPFPSVRLNVDTIIDLFPRKMWQKGVAGGSGRTNLNHFCISMDRRTWGELVDRLEANGVAIENGPVPRWGAHGTGTSVYFRDPENNLIEARYYDHPDAP